MWLATLACIGLFAYSYNKYRQECRAWSICMTCEGECVYIGQSMSAYVITNMLHFRNSKIYPNLLQLLCPFDYGIYILMLWHIFIQSIMVVLILGLHIKLNEGTHVKFLQRIEVWRKRNSEYGISNVSHIWCAFKRSSDFTSYIKQFEGFVESVNEISVHVYLVNIPEPVQYHSHAMAFPFDLRSECIT